MRAPLRNKLVGPAEIGWCVDWADRRNGSATFGHQQAGPGAHALQMTTEMRLQLTNADGLHVGSPGKAPQFYHDVVTSVVSTRAHHSEASGPAGVAAHPAEAPPD